MEELAGFYAWETIDLELIIEPSGVLDGFEQIMVSVVQSSHRVNKQYYSGSPEVSGDVINLHLNQEETGLFKFYPQSECGANTQNPRVQVNILYPDGERDASTIELLDLYENLYKKVMA